jgi:hypothetical protein
MARATTTAAASITSIATVSSASITSEPLFGTKPSSLSASLGV